MYTNHIAFRDPHHIHVHVLAALTIFLVSHTCGTLMVTVQGRCSEGNAPSARSLRLNIAVADTTLGPPMTEAHPINSAMMATNTRRFALHSLFMETLKLASYDDETCSAICTTASQLLYISARQWSTQQQHQGSGLELNKR